jgi:predicted metal-dependent hydrolase
MLEVKKTNEGIVLSLSFQLDKEDATDLIKELQNYVSKEDARLQAQSKLELEKEMKRAFVDVLDSEYLETKFATVYKLDAINREVEILRKKLNKQ